MVGNPSIELISADGLAVFASIPRVSKIREATPKQLLPEPYDNVLFYSRLIPPALPSRRSGFALFRAQATSCDRKRVIAGGLRADRKTADR